MAGLVTVACTVLAILLAAPAPRRVPRAALGAVVVYAAVRLVDVKEFVRFARFRRSELAARPGDHRRGAAGRVLTGSSWPSDSRCWTCCAGSPGRTTRSRGTSPGSRACTTSTTTRRPPVPGLLVYRYDSPLFFANAEDFHHRALAAVAENAQPVEWFVLNTEAIVEVDITSVDVLETLRRELTDAGTVVALARVKQDLRDQLGPTGLLERIGEDRIFPTLPTAVEAFQAWVRTHPT